MAVETGTQGAPVTREMLEKLDRGEMEMSELSKDQVRWIAMNGNLVEDGDDPQEVEETRSKSSRRTREEIPKAEEVEKPAQKPKEDLGTKYKQKADEANHYANLLKNKERAEQEHLRKLKTDAIYRQKWMEQELGVAEQHTQQNSYKPSAPEEYLTDDHLGKIDRVYQELEELKKREAQKAEAEIAHLKRLKEEEKFSSEMRQIEELQAEAAHLRTQKPFRELNSEFIAWKQSLGAENVNKYMSDPAFRKQCDEQGYAAPQDMDKIIKILTIHQKYSSEGYPTLRSAFRDSKYFDETISQQKAAVASQHGDAYRKKLEEVKQQPKILNHMAAQNPMDQVGMGPGGMSEEQMLQFEREISRQGRPMTPEQKIKHNAIMQYLRSQSTKG